MCQEFPTSSFEANEFRCVTPKCSSHRHVYELVTTNVLNSQTIIGRGNPLIEWAIIDNVIVEAASLMHGSHGKNVKPERTSSSPKLENTSLKSKSSGNLSSDVQTCWLFALTRVFRVFAQGPLKTKTLISLYAIIFPLFCRLPQVFDIDSKNS